MSLNQTVTKAVNEVINNFIQQISSKYDLDPNDLLQMWDCNSILTKVVPKKSLVTNIPSATDDIDENALLQYKKPEIQALCRQRGLKCTGTKEQLIALLLSKDGSSAVKKEVVSKKSEPIKKVSSTPVAQKLVSSIPTVAIRRNQHGNHEHPETSFVFDKKTKKAIGKQNEDGTIDDLTSEDIDICNQWKFQYVLPDNLDKKTKLNDVKVDELDYEDEEVLESDEDEEEAVIDEEELVQEEDFEDEEEEYEDDDVEYE
jgi:hypothetical protein